MGTVDEANAATEATAEEVLVRNLGSSNDLLAGLGDLGTGAADLLSDLFWINNPTPAHHRAAQAIQAARRGASTRVQLAHSSDKDLAVFVKDHVAKRKSAWAGVAAAVVLASGGTYSKHSSPTGKPVQLGQWSGVLRGAAVAAAIKEGRDHDTGDAMDDGSHLSSDSWSDGSEEWMMATDYQNSPKKRGVPIAPVVGASSRPGLEWLAKQVQEIADAPSLESIDAPALTNELQPTSPANSTGSPVTHNRAALARALRNKRQLAAQAIQAARRGVVARSSLVSSSHTKLADFVKEQTLKRGQTTLWLSVIPPADEPDLKRSQSTRAASRSTASAAKQCLPSSPADTLEHATVSSMALTPAANAPRVSEALRQIKALPAGMPPGTRDQSTSEATTMASHSQGVESGEAHDADDAATVESVNLHTAAPAATTASAPRAASSVASLLPRPRPLRRT